MAKRKNGEGSYGETVRNGYKYKTFTYPDGKRIYAKTSALLKEKKKEEDARRSEEYYSQPQNNNDYVFLDYCSQWLKTMYKQVADTTFDQYDLTIKNKIENYTGYDLANKQLKGLNAEVFTDYFASLAKQYSKASINKTWSVIRRVLIMGFNNKDIPQFNVEMVKIPKEREVKVKKKVIPFITFEDMEELYKVAYSKDSTGKYIYGNASKVIVFIMYSGVRIGEAIGLTWKDVAPDYSWVNISASNAQIIDRDENGQAVLSSIGNVRHKQIQKEPKSSTGSRHIPIPERGRTVLRFFAELNPKHSYKDNVFLSGTNTIYTRRGIERCLERMLQNSNCRCKEYTPHSLRHGYGSVLLSKGVDIKIVSELLGHTDVAFTYNVYIGILKDDKVKAVESVFD